MRSRRAIVATVAMVGSCVLCLTGSAQAYNPITPTMAGTTVTLNGKNLTIDQVIQVARHGAQVRLAPAARARSEAAYELLLEGARQDIPIYFFNRGTGSGRETPIFYGDPLRPANRELLLARQLRIFKSGPRQGIGPEVVDEEIVRAMMVVRANTMVYEAATPQLTQMLVDLLNKYIAPVVQSRGSPGEGDLPQMGNVGGTMVGVGQAYYRGQRMSALQALTSAGLRPLVPFAADDAALVSTNAFSAGQAALLLFDARRTLDWSDLTYTMSMLGLNSSITPLAAVPQNARPFPYQNRLARRLLNLIRGSYLFEYETPPGFDGRRIIQDPLSFRDYSQRNGAAWEAYARLKKNILIQINSSDHNPAVVPGTKPSDSWELDTPWLRRYLVAPGEKTEGGYILSNANFVAQPWATDLEAFTNTLANAVAAARAARAALPGHVLHGGHAVGGAVRGRDRQRAAAGGELHDLRPDGGDPDAPEPGAGAGQLAGAKRGGHGVLHAPARRAGAAGGGQLAAADRPGDALGELLDGGPQGPEPEPLLRRPAGGGARGAAGGRPLAGRAGHPARAAAGRPGLDLPAGQPRRRVHGRRRGGAGL